MFSFNKENISTDKIKIKNLLERGVEEIFIKEDLEKKLLSGKQLRVKLGFDPTGDKIHIGRAIVLRKLREFQDLGHKIIFLVGDFTALIGDPSDKLEKRPMLTKEKVEENLKTYKEQVGKIVDIKKAEFVYNSTWLKKLTFKEVAELAESFSVSQMINRRNFKDRLDNGDEVSLREFMYPLMQGYDSVELKSDVEIGGFDQLFNLKAGRTIQKKYGQKQQDILTTVMLEGVDGRKMSTSWGNVINVTDESNDMYGKIMSLKDELIGKYFLLCTDLNEEDIKELESRIDSEPKEIKMKLAREIVKIYHSESESEKAQENWIRTFSEGGTPEDIKTKKVKEGVIFRDVVIENNLIKSNSEWRRLVEQGGASFNDEKIKDVNLEIKESGILKIGKRKFLKIEIE